MSRLKKLRNSLPKLKKQELNRPSNISISFQMVTTERNYTFERFNESLRLGLRARQSLDDLLVELSSHTLRDLGMRRKDQFGGFEMIPVSQIKTCLCKRSDLTPDVSVWVFRFCKSQYRLIAYKYAGNNENVLYILGYDFDYSAYDHGS